MLTKNDLQAIQQLVRSEVRNEIKAEIDPIKKDMKVLKRDIKKIHHNVETIIDVFDKRDIKLRRRVIKIEEHLGLETPKN